MASDVKAEAWVAGRRMHHCIMVSISHGHGLRSRETAQYKARCTFDLACPDSRVHSASRTLDQVYRKGWASRMGSRHTIAYV